MAGNLNLTPEQADIIAHAHGNTIIRAFAGTGKTTTLIQLARTRPDKKFLYLAYNNSIAKDSSKKFPANVECKTINSFAYQRLKDRYQDKFKDNLSVYDINKIMQDENRAKFICDTLKRFFRSNDETLSVKHISKHDLGRFLSPPPESGKKLTQKESIARARQAGGLMVKVVRRCQQILAMVFDEKNLEIAIDHDGILKLFSLEFSAHLFGCYDYILFDEAQDSNDVIYYILQKAKIPVIAVGDSHQSIYAFRGAVDSLDRFDGKVFYLSQSFRFGDNVAALANELLEKFKDEKVKIKGNGSSDVIVYKENSAPEQFNEEMRISRTNSGLIENAINCLETETPYHIVGGFNKSLVKMIWSIIGLSIKRRDFIEDETVLEFFDNDKTLKELRKYAVDNGAIEIKSALTLYLKYSIKILDLIKQIKECNQRKDKCHVWLSTAHKSKGLEADKVVLANDFKTFKSCKSSGGDRVEMLENDFQEINILYVAVTRAKKYLYINENLNEFLTMANISLVPSSASAGAGAVEADYAAKIDGPAPCPATTAN